MTYEEEAQVSKWCGVCFKKGAIVVRTISYVSTMPDGAIAHSSVRTFNRINWCQNPECFRYFKVPPANWTHDKNAIDDNKVQYQRQSTRRLGKPFTKAAHDKESVLDGKSSKVCGVQEFCVGLYLRPNKIASSSSDDRQEHRTVRQAFDDIIRVPSEDGSGNTMEG